MLINLESLQRSLDSLTTSERERLLLTSVLNVGSELLTEVEHPGDYFLGCVYLEHCKSVRLLRGDFSYLEVPFEWFDCSLNPFNFRVEDCGQTLACDNFEMSSDSILYHFDSEYRLKSNAVRSRII